MIKGSVSISQTSVGQRVYLENNKFGILRYFGSTHFADGLWCGVELDEETGEHDGIIDDIQYFTCKNYHGTFVSPSELNIISNDKQVPFIVDKNSNPTENYLTDSSIQNFDLCNISVSSDSPYTTPKSSQPKNKSFSISTRFFVKQLSVISEENIENVMSLKAVNFGHLNTEAGLSKSENVSTVEQALNPNSKKENEVSFQEFEEDYDSDDSLGLISHLLDDCRSSCDNLLDCADKLNLNTTENHLNSLGYAKEWELDFMDYNTDSPFQIIPKISATNSDESPVCTNISAPKFASTPKHEINYSYVFDEAILTTQNLSPALHESKEDGENGKHLECALNKTIDIEVCSEHALPIITNAQTSVIKENKDSGKSILNVTCSIDKPLNSNQILLSKTFDNLDPLCSNICDIPVVNTEKLNLMNKSNVRHNPLSDYNQSIQHVCSAETDVVITDLKSQEKDINVFSENMLNVTRDILKPLDTHSENLDKCSEYVGSIPSNILNTTTIYSKVAGEYKIAEDNALSESLDDEYSENARSIPSNILNTTTTYSKLTEEHKIEDNTLSEGSENKYSENAKSSLSSILNNNSYSKVPGENKVKENNALPGNTDDKYLENRKSLPSSILNTIGSCSKVTVEDDAFSEDLDDKYLENAETIPSGILNTTMSYPKSTDEKTSAENSGNFNITYEKIDASLELESKIRASQPFKNVNNLSEIMKNPRIAFKGEFRNKFSEFGKGITRKSVGCIGETTNPEMKDKKVRRNSVIGSMCSPLRHNELTINTQKDTSVKCSMNENNRKVTFLECQPKSDNLNGNMNDFAYSKPEFSDIKQEVTPVSEAKFRGRDLVDKTVNLASFNSEVGKTVVKKPRSSMNVLYKKSAAELCKIPSLKTQRIITFPEKKSSLIQTTTTVEPEGDSHASFDKTNLKKHTVFTNIPGEEKKQKSSRIPGKCILSQKNIYRNIRSSERNTGMKPCSQQAVSKISVSRSRSVNYHPIKSNLGDTVVISGEQSINKQTHQTIKPHSQQTASKISVSRSHSASYRPIHKPNLGNTILISGQQSSSQQNTQTIKPHSQQAASKISVSRSCSASYRPIHKPNLDNTVLISGQQNSSQQITQTLKPSNNKISSQNLTFRKPLNLECDSTKKANLNITLTSDHQSSSEENTQNATGKFVPKITSHIPLSRIPSVSRNNKKQATEVISSLTLRRNDSTNNKRINQLKYNLR